jgi:endonuclease/exonuclease/phosphatase family metal-dependent hydrolase
MKKLSTIHKFLFILNSIAAIILLLAYLLPFISPKNYPSLSVVSLGVPILIIINILFCIFWLVQLKRPFLLSFLTLLLGFNYVTSIYSFSGKDIEINTDLTIMSYNVKGFNHLGWKNNKETTQKILDFIEDEHPDILALQEHYINFETPVSFPYHYSKTKKNTDKYGYTIYSKYQILNSGSLNFKESANNAIFIDIKRNQDTIRVYNIHLESLKVNPNKENFGEENSEKLYQRIKSTFSKQALQTETFLNHRTQWSGKTIICADLNNTAFSWVYDQVSDTMKDAFLEAGKGFGKTYDYVFPLRIDFILSDENSTVNLFKTYNVTYSDHFPIKAQLNWK